MPMTNLINVCAQCSADKLAKMRTKFHVIQVKLIMPVWCFTVQCDPSVSSLSVVAGRCGIVDRDWADLMGRAPPDTLNKNGKCYCLWQSQCHTGHWECKLWKLIFTLIFYLRPPGPPSKGFFPFPLLYFIGYKSQNRLKVEWWDILHNVRHVSPAECECLQHGGGLRLDSLLQDTWTQSPGPGPIRTIYTIHSGTGDPPPPLSHFTLALPSLPTKFPLI